MPSTAPGFFFVSRTSKAAGLMREYEQGGFSRNVFEDPGRTVLHSPKQFYTLSNAPRLSSLFDFPIGLISGCGFL